MNKNLKHILVIDDDTRLRNLLGKFLIDNGYQASLAKDSEEANLLIAQHNFDLLIVDIMLPHQNGFDFTSNLRQHSKIPVIILTARGEPSDRIKGLEIGADDYMPKPFEPKELLLRINNIFKRTIDTEQNYTKPLNDHKISFGEFNFNTQQLRLKKGEEFVHLTDNEAKILKILADNQGKPVARQTLCDLLPGIDDQRSIDVSITRLRKKIENNPKQPYYLQTVRNFGYILYD